MPGKRVDRCRSWWALAGAKVRFSVWLLVFCVVGWVATAAWVWITDGRFDPFKQVMLAISWGALIVTAINTIFTSQVAEQQAEDAEPGDDPTPEPNEPR